MPYRTNIHELLDTIDRMYGTTEPAYEDLNIREVIVDSILMQAGGEDRLDDEQQHRVALLRMRYTDVILVFDYDPQDNRFEPRRLERFMAVFNDSTDPGALYLNYPSVESFCDFENPFDLSYLSSDISMSELRGYKRRTGARRLRNIDEITGPLVSAIVALNASKIQHLCEDIPAGETLVGSGDPSLAATTRDLDLTAFLALENRHLAAESRVFVCNTCLFFVCQWPRAVDGAWRKALRLAGSFR